MKIIAFLLVGAGVVVGIYFLCITPVLWASSRFAGACTVFAALSLFAGAIALAQFAIESAPR